MLQGTTTSTESNTVPTGDQSGETADWYARRDELFPGQVFRMHDGSVIKLDRSVPGDGSKWYVQDWWQGWSCMDSTIEPGDLKTRLRDDFENSEVAR